MPKNPVKSRVCAILKTKKGHIRLPSSPLENPVKSRVSGLACYLGNRQVTTFLEGEHLNGVFLVKIL